MGQSLNKSGNDEKKEKEKREKEIERLLEQCYDVCFGDWRSADFYQAICLTIEEINKTLSSTQLRVPEPGTLENAYIKHHQGREKSLTKEEFQKVLREVILDTGDHTNIGAKDMLLCLYLFGVPATALFLKQRLAPKLIPNEAFIPAVTSATVFILAKLNKI